VRTAALLATLFVLAGCSSNDTSSPKSVVVTPTGQVGPLRIDRSNRAQVIAFAGRPESERRGRYSDYPPFDALGYGCHGKTATSADGIPRCKTVFYLDVRSGKLALLITADDRYVAPRGIHIGMPTATVERLVHRRVVVGCESDLVFTTRTGYLVIGLTGGTTPGPGLHLVGGRVTFVVVHSQRRNPGVLDCIDS
jgi:hypothetical protein